MRSYVLIFSTLAILGTLFLVYWRSQPATVASVQDARHFLPPPAQTQSSDRFAKIGSGSRPWVKEFDKAGRLASQYRAERYVPRQDGTVQMIAPEADFFLGHDQRLHVTGVNGEAVMRASGATDGAKNAPVSPSAPTRGRLNDVTMQLIQGAGAAEQVVFTMTTNNIGFDNESFLITTEGYDRPDGTEVAPDQVPVQLRGQYEFDGRGLTLRWNDRDGRLELLEIAHGQELRILHPHGTPSTASTATTRPQATPAKPAPAPSEAATAPASPHASTAPALLAVKAPNTVTPSTTPATPGGDEKPIYLATFSDAVRVTQGNQTLILADLMRLHFRQKDQQEPPPAASNSQPTTRAASALTPPPVAEAKSPPTGSVASTTPATPSSPTTQPTADEEPIVVTWTGRLHIAPEPRAPAALGPGDSIIELAGIKSPVFVHRAPTDDEPASKVRCAGLFYFTRDGSVSLTGSEQFGPVELTRSIPSHGADDQPMAAMRVITESLDYSGTTHVATLSGAGSAVLPLDDRNDPTGMSLAQASWSRQARLTLAGGQTGQLQLTKADLLGEVDVRRPKMQIKSEALSVRFGPATEGLPPLTAADNDTAKAAVHDAKSSDNALNEVAADGSVHCALVDDAGKAQVIDGQALNLRFAAAPDGRRFAREVDGAGDIHATDGGQELFCQRLHVLLRPASRPQIAAAPTTNPSSSDEDQEAAVELERLDARQRVKVVGKDASVALCDQLLLLMSEHQPHVTLTGQEAILTDAKKNVLRGAMIVLEPSKQLAHVVGAGSLHMTGQPLEQTPATLPATTQPARPPRATDVAWHDAAVVNGAINAIDLTGKVVATSPDPDGTINAAQCERLHVDLLDKPKAPAATTRPANAVQLDFMRDKQPSLLTLAGNAVLHSRLTDAEGHLLREMELKAPSIYYTLTKTVQYPARSLIVPSAGTLLARDYRTPDPKAQHQPGFGGGRGDTAFRWKHGLIYSEDDRRATMIGDVLTVYQPDNSHDLPVSLAGDQLICLMEPASAKPGPDAGDASGHIRSVEVTGNAVATRGDVQLSSTRITYQPASRWIIADGTSRDPVTVDENGTQSTYDQVQWNTDTWNFRLKRPAGQVRRGGE